jgi:hypothetical protein
MRLKKGDVVANKWSGEFGKVHHVSKGNVGGIILMVWAELGR